jgi:hypothetical protein
MGRIYRHKENRGVHIRLPSKSIDIIVDQISGEDTRREATFEIYGVRQMKKVHRASTYPEFTLPNQISFSILDAPAGELLPVEYGIPADYPIRPVQRVIMTRRLGQEVFFEGEELSFSVKGERIYGTQKRPECDFTITGHPEVEQVTLRKWRIHEEVIPGIQMKLLNTYDGRIHLLFFVDSTYRTLTSRTA